MMSLASLEYSQLSHFQKLALLLVIGPHNLPGNVRVPFSIRSPFQMIEKNNDNSVVQPSGGEGGYTVEPTSRVIDVTEFSGLRFDSSIVLVPPLQIGIPSEAYEHSPIH